MSDASGRGSILARLREVAGPELVERLLALDELGGARPRPSTPPPPPDPGATIDYDVGLVGGGLSLLYAPLLAARGLRVAVFERFRAGLAHREWNASAPELDVLVRLGLVSTAELERLVVARYRAGTCRWHGGGDHRVTGVLDCAVDAGGLLALTRGRAEALGAGVFDGHALEGFAPSADAVRLRLRAGGTLRDVTVGVMLDGRGAESAWASADLACPTVGGVVRGLAPGTAPDELDPELGEILVTTEGVADGRQHLWETFPGRAGEAAVYLFYYTRTRALARGGLVALYDRFFRRLGAYKRGEARLVRPTFGYIPGWSRLSPPPRSPNPRVLLVGDAAARHSPLTFCGFGATLRSLGRASDAVFATIEGRGPRVAVDDRGVHRGTGALAWLLASPSADPRRANDLNELLDAAFASLAGMGEEAYRALLRDEMGVTDFVAFLRATARARPRVYAEALRGLGPVRAGRWLAGIARELFAS